MIYKIMEFKISIITVVRNDVSNIAQTILSVVSNKPNWIEYIVVDGLSTDGTTEVIRKYETQIDIFISEKDRGIYDAMNKGIAKAAGNFIGILNSGDIFLPGALELVTRNVLAIQEKYCILAAGVSNGDSYGNCYSTFIPDLNSIENRFRMMPLNHTAMFVSREIYSELLVYDPTLKIASDYKFVLDVISQNIKILFMKEVIVHMAEGGISDNLDNAYTLLREGFFIRRKYKGLIYCSIVGFRTLLGILVVHFQRKWLRSHQ